MNKLQKEDLFIYENGKEILQIKNKEEIEKKKMTEEYKNLISFYYEIKEKD